MSEVILPCDHVVDVSHERGGRLVCCDKCDMRVIVQAKPSPIIEYVVMKASSRILDKMSEEDARRQQKFDQLDSSEEIVKVIEGE